MSDFSDRLIRWQQRHGRHGLPWQKTRDPYRVWLSEIMLQQTQVATVIPYYDRFLVRFPTLADLAAAPVEAVMEPWSGLGYYARARNLHACAREVMTAHGGEFPRTPEALAALPGIGRSTANAIATFCFGAHAPILDGNVKRVLCRCFGIEGFPGTTATESRLWRDAESLLPANKVSAYIQGQMDLGATICTRGKPRCEACPLREICVAHREGRVAELPTPRPKKALPEREATLLVLRDKERFLLERRPPAGIWGGLLSLPELPAGAELASHIERQLGARLVAVTPAPSFVHTFSHFRLRIRPLLCEVQSQPRAAESDHQWLTKTELARAALPAPIRKILSAFP
ncbi:MAG: A/G-specific adenine glycosylase [Sulfurisoma sp.]|nr:A/G-specific adenine glycosylase [Sulfurisoma sp.]